MKLLILILLLGNCLAQTISIHYRTLSNQKEYALATIQFTPGSKKAEVEVEDLSSHDTTGEICLGTNSLPDHECFAYVDSVKFPQFHIYLDSTGNVDHLAATVNAATKSSVMVHPFEAAPVPNLNPKSFKHNAKSKGSSPQTQKVLKKMVIKGENGEDVEVEGEVEVEVEVDDRSFIQKYWVYIVPPLIMYMMASDKK